MQRAAPHFFCKSSPAALVKTSCMANFGYLLRSGFISILNNNNDNNKNNKGTLFLGWLLITGLLRYSFGSDSRS